MSSKSLWSKVLSFVFAAVLFNLIACSKAKFEAANSQERSQAPVADNATITQGTPDSGEVVRGEDCGDLCNTTDDGTGLIIYDNGDDGSQPTNGQDGGLGTPVGVNTTDGGTAPGNPQTDVGIGTTTPGTVGVGTINPVEVPNTDIVIFNDDEVVVGTEVKPIPQVTNKNPPGSTFDPIKPVTEKDGENCYKNVYGSTSRSANKEIQGVTMWLVVDSSRSFDEERLAVAKAVVDGYVTSLRRKVPVTISVIAGHAPSSPFDGIASSAPSRNTKVFYRHGNEPLSVTIRPGMTADQIRKAEADLLSKLDENMKESPISRAKRVWGTVDGMKWSKRGPHSGSDEMGLLNFSDAMDKATIPENHAWVTLFLSDENDVCMPFEKTRKDGKRYYVYSHQNEEEMFQKYCQNFNVESIYNKALAFAGDRAFVLGALVYTNQGTIPKGVQHSVGRGYLELVRDRGHSGAIIDLAARDQIGVQNVANRLVSEMAYMTSEAEAYQDRFPIYNEKGEAMNLSEVGTYHFGGQTRYNLQVYVDGQKVDYTPDRNNDLIQPSKLGGQTTIRFCTQ